MTKKIALVTAAALVALTFWAHLPLAGSDPIQRCTSAKLKAARKKAASKIACHAKAAARGATPDPLCLGKAEMKFSESWGKIEARGGCGTTGDETSIEASVDTFVDDLVAALVVTTTTTTTTRFVICSTTTTMKGCANQTTCSQGLCANGPCQTGETGQCECAGPAIPCGTIFFPSLCGDGGCPVGMQCVALPYEPPSCQLGCECR